MRLHAILRWPGACPVFCWRRSTSRWLEKRNRQPQRFRGQPADLRRGSWRCARRKSRNSRGEIRANLGDEAVTCPRVLAAGGADQCACVWAAAGSKGCRLVAATTRPPRRNDGKRGRGAAKKVWLQAAIACWRAFEYGGHCNSLLMLLRCANQHSPRPRRESRRGFCLCEEGPAFQAASGASGIRPRVGRLRTQRWSSSGSIIVFLPAFLAVNVPSRIASKIRVLDTPALAAASSGLKPSRGMARPVTLPNSCPWWRASAFGGIEPDAMALTPSFLGSRRTEIQNLKTSAPLIVARYRRRVFRTWSLSISHSSTMLAIAATCSSIQPPSPISSCTASGQLLHEQGSNP